MAKKPLNPNSPDIDGDGDIDRTDAVLTARSNAIKRSMAQRDFNALLQQLRSAQAIGDRTRVRMLSSKIENLLMQISMHGRR